MSDASSPAWLWAAVDRLLALEPSLDDIMSHRIELLAARRRRERGLDVPPPLAAAELSAAVATLAAPVLLERVRGACDGPVILIKGPEAAAHYPNPALRRFWDVDLLVPDAAAVQRALQGAGFQPMGDPLLYADIHHLRPLALPGLPLAVEIHDRPKWVEGLVPVDMGELLAAARPATVGVEGIDALPPAQHALLLAAHSWAHEPLRRLHDVFDVALVASACRPGDIEQLAADWGVERLWTVTRRAVDAVVDGAALPRPTRRWARNLVTCRERTVLENHLQRFLSGFSILPPGRALLALGPALLAEVRPDDEPWLVKARRSLQALMHATKARSEHESAAGLR